LSTEELRDELDGGCVRYTAANFRSRTTGACVLAGAALLIESVSRLGSARLGFDQRDLMTMSVRLPARDYGSPASRARFYDRLLKDIERVPGLEGAALATGLLRGRGGNMLVVRGRPEPSPDVSAPDVAQDDISADYFGVLAVPLLAGRWFDAGDREGVEPVAMVNEALARKYFPNESAVDRSAHRVAPGIAWQRAPHHASR
jgi:hypothetical protein